MDSSDYPVGFVWDFTEPPQLIRLPRKQRREFLRYEQKQKRRKLRKKKQ